MNSLFVLLLMIFLHIVNDYNLQGWLASAKQKEYWEKNAPDELYKHDYIWALIMHSFSWTFMVMLPIAIFTKFNIGLAFIIAFVINTTIHAILDHLKANVQCISLVTDQLGHMMQIMFTWAILYVGG